MNSFTTVKYTFKVSKHIIIGQSTNINVFSWLLFFFKLREREREREWYTILGIREKWPQSYLSYFSMVFHWRIFLLSRANRLYSIFLHWLEEPGVLCVSGILLSSTRNTGYGSSARYEPCSKTNLLTIYFRWRGGVPTSVLGSQPIIWLLSSPFLVSRFFRATRCHPSPVTGYKHLLVLIPTSVTHILS